VREHALKADMQLQGFFFFDKTTQTRQAMYAQPNSVAFRLTLVAMET
jgi:hypothetical protein